MHVSKHSFCLMSVCMFLCMSLCFLICLSVCFLVCLSVFLSVCLVVCLFICLFVFAIESVMLLFFNGHDAIFRNLFCRYYLFVIKKKWRWVRFLAKQSQYLKTYTYSSTAAMLDAMARFWHNILFKINLW